MPTIRAARPDDAEAMLVYLRRLVAEPDIPLPLAADEPPVTLTVEEERRILEEYAAAENAVFLVAEVDGRVVGQLTCQAPRRAAMRHAAVLGVSVDRDWRDRGVGRALLLAAIDWARRSGVITRIELTVYAGNARARHLYESVGFHVEGHRRRSIFQRGAYIDDVLMALLL